MFNAVLAVGLQTIQVVLVNGTETRHAINAVLVHSRVQQTRRPQGVVQFLHRPLGLFQTFGSTRQLQFVPATQIQQYKCRGGKKEG